MVSGPASTMRVTTPATPRRRVRWRSSPTAWSAMTSAGPSSKRRCPLARPRSKCSTTRLRQPTSTYSEASYSPPVASSNCKSRTPSTSRSCRRHRQTRRPHRPTRARAADTPRASPSTRGCTKGLQTAILCGRGHRRRRAPLRTDALGRGAKADGGAPSTSSPRALTRTAMAASRTVGAALGHVSGEDCRSGAARDAKHLSHKAEPRPLHAAQ
ncbi:hypothetical protein M885DRAFT_531984 [Pelagophyceae sp. CCMP2097]|nr:hypothetical protein M885DRAFT_531984 [Pelagophyceae sp. CCMP2097]|mmetsp:Transcript_22730/g.76822  ORF Transcript_22730/g.76822 Transcript_22730/m.76822 type:complete len:213 (+) Transcript_22730:137-775(+)